MYNHLNSWACFVVLNLAQLLQLQLLTAALEVPRLSIALTLDFFVIINLGQEQSSLPFESPMCPMFVIETRMNAHTHTHGLEKTVNEIRHDPLLFTKSLSVLYLILYGDVFLKI